MQREINVFSHPEIFPEGLGENSFPSKADTLELLKGKVRAAVILPIFKLNWCDWSGRKHSSLESFFNFDWSSKSLIVRSSHSDEDSLDSSQAGKYVSVGKVQGIEALEKAIESVFESYGEKNEKSFLFIQPFLDQVEVSGVAFTVDPNTGSPYFVINYDDKSGETDTITGGKKASQKTFYYYKKFEENTLPNSISILRFLLKELESLFGGRPLDVEFAIKDRKIFLLQVRPLVLKSQSLGIPQAQFESAIYRAYKKIQVLNRPHPYLKGSQTILGIMPDWNPAEIIGVRPRPLALSLYREIITDNIWAYQRDNYGYRSLRSFPLLVELEGLPYIDVRVSFNSFIPASVEEPLAEKLVNYYLERLKTLPIFHDKVEFEIVFSCYTLDLSQRLEELKKFGFESHEISKLLEGLRSLTNQIINPDTGLWRKDRTKIQELEKRYDLIEESELDAIGKIFWHLEDLKRYGTLPFAGLARAGFIAIQFLQSLVKVGILSNDDYFNFLQSLDSVSSQMGKDLAESSSEVFLSKYGHLRPGTYDILSPRYDEASHEYFDWSKLNSEEQYTSKRNLFTVSLAQLKKTEQLLKDHGLSYSALGLFEFIKEAIEGREYSKFVFTKSLSRILSHIGELGKTFQLSKEDMSFVSISLLKNWVARTYDEKTELRQEIEKNREKYQVTKALHFPPVISKAEEVLSFFVPETSPNYITQKKARGDVFLLKESKGNLEGTVLFIPSADPGYDWIFSHKISGFVTQYGGVNSHMAIRSQELGIPAVIGAGEALFLTWSQFQVLEIDCENRKVTGLL